ncbi:MAG: hypothetical protein KAS32_30995 [Candidatus Peribacteraceae bacterium]|nr:hypothetical protein [Candidatus Peribacteraceae bacterium]
MKLDDIRRMERTLEELNIDIDTRILWVADAIEEMNHERSLREPDRRVADKAQDRRQGDCRKTTYLGNDRRKRLPK